MLRGSTWEKVISRWWFYAFVAYLIRLRSLCYQRNVFIVHIQTWRIGEYCEGRVLYSSLYDSVKLEKKIVVQKNSYNSSFRLKKKNVKCFVICLKKYYVIDFIESIAWHFFQQVCKRVLEKRGQLGNWVMNLFKIKWPKNCYISSVLKFK